MRTRLIIGLVFLLVLAACGSSTSSTTTTTIASSTTAAGTTTTAEATTTTEPPGFTVTSDDGDLVIDVPHDAMAEDPGITIRVLTADEYPPELAEAAENPNSRIYQLEPEGLQFDAPVRITRRIDAAGFDGLGDDMIPLVAIVTRNADGTYEPYADLRVVRDGADVFASGTTTHFSPFISVNMQEYAQWHLDDSHLGYRTEVGVKLKVSYTFQTAGGATLKMPSVLEPIGYSRSLVSIIFGGTGSDQEVDCGEIESGRPRIGLKFTILGTAAADEVGLGSLPSLVTGLDSLELETKSVQPLVCLDPMRAFTMAVTAPTITAKVDHPGGKVIIPNANFHGGASGLDLSGTFTYGYDTGFETGWAGLISDTDGNGVPSGGDTMYAPWTLMPRGEQFGYVAPLYGYGKDFVYMIDSSQFSGAPEGNSWTLKDAIPAFYANYTGDQRFETSWGIVSVGGVPFTVQVTSEETETTGTDATLEPLSTYHLLQWVPQF